MHRYLSKIVSTSIAFAVLSITTLKAQAALLVSSAETKSILRYDEKTGAFIDTFVTSGSGGLTRAVGLAFGPDKNLYVTTFNTDNPSENASVLRYSGETGSFINTFVSAASGNLSHPTNLSFAPDNNLYVADLVNKGIQRFDGKTGALIDTFVPAGSNGRNFSSLTFGPDSNIYVTTSSIDDENIADKDVRRYDGNTGAFIDVFVPAGSGGLNLPSGLTFGPDGNLYVGDFTSQGAVRRYDGKTGAFIDTFVAPGSGGLSFPSLGLSFATDGNLYVSSIANSSVLRYNGKTGAFIDTFVPGGSGGLGGPEDLIFTPTAKTTSVPEPSSGLAALGITTYVFSRSLKSRYKQRKQQKFVKQNTNISHLEFKQN